MPEPQFFLIPKAHHPIMAPWYTHKIKANLGKDVYVVRMVKFEKMAKGGNVDIMVLEFVTKITASVFIDPERQ